MAFSFGHSGHPAEVNTRPQSPSPLHVQDALQQRQVDCTIHQQQQSFSDDELPEYFMATRGCCSKSRSQRGAAPAGQREGGTGHASCYWCYRGSFFN
ncbi:hypothetical protein EYF80_030487 [Liparis tanakae]|uniref:Uncharacterized protein n=1 Tax=Liparis tanakae TaxID=230148 RepID=A0A4Z2H1H9_9TELE|nr:hypothetical protein EYF80_030487 [Liparis tanakae]